MIKDGVVAEQGGHSELLANNGIYRQMRENHISVRDSAFRREVQHMLNILKKFFDFVGEENKKKFRISIVLSVFQALSAAMKIPAIMLILQAIMANRLTDTVIWQASGIMLGGLLVENIVKYKATMLQTEGGLQRCGVQTNRDCGTSQVPADGIF